MRLLQELRAMPDEVNGVRLRVGAINCDVYKHICNSVGVSRLAGCHKAPGCLKSLLNAELSVVSYWLISTWSLSLQRLSRCLKRVFAF